LFGFGSFVGAGQWSEEVFWFAVLYMMFIGSFALIPLAICHKFFRSSGIALFVLALAFLVPMGLLKFRVIMPSSELLIISAISAAVWFIRVFSNRLIWTPHRGTPANAVSLQGARTAVPVMQRLENG
jgi:hypothetical protein